MSFTFGGFPTFLMERISTTSMSLNLPEEKRVQIRGSLSKQSTLFSLDPILIIIRDYILGAPLLMIDLFPSTRITMHEIHILLCSVACCYECTEEVRRLAEKCVVKEIKVEDIPSAPKGLVDVVDEGVVGKPFSMKNMCKYYMSLLASKYILVKNLASLNNLMTPMGEEERNFIVEIMNVILGPSYWKSKDPFDIYYVVFHAFTETYVRPQTLIAFCLNVIQVDEVNIFKRKTRKHLAYSNEHIASILTSCATAPHLSGKQIARNLNLLRRNFSVAAYFYSLDQAGSIALQHFIRRDDLTFKLPDFIVICMHIYIRICREGATDIYSLMHFLWQLPLGLLRKYSTVLKEGGSNGKYLSATVSHEGSIYHLQMGTIKVNGQSIPGYAHNDHQKMIYSVLLYIIADKFLWTYDRNRVIDMLKGIMIPSDIPEIEGATYKDPIQHLLVPIRGEHIFDTNKVEEK